MYGAILGVHVLISLGLIVVVLLQSGKGGGLAGAFGGSGGVGAVFGGQAAATFLTKATRYLAIGFMLTSLTMALVVRGRIGGGTVAGGLENRQATPVSAVGDVVTEEGIPQGLPETPTEGLPEAPTEGLPEAPTEGPPDSEGGLPEGTSPPAEGETAPEPNPIEPEGE